MEDRAEKLALAIRRHQGLYYNGVPEISDAEFDRLWDRLRRLDPDHPLLRRIGADVDPERPKRRHIIPMNSQDKAADAEAFLRWAEKRGEGLLIAQYKLDGISIELQYSGGAFHFGVTRGDGVVGDDVTDNVGRMGGAPKQIAADFDGAVRGEIIMLRSVHRSRYPDYANCRNTASGIVKRKDGVGSQYLQIFCYDALHRVGQTDRFSGEVAKLEWLANQGFDTVEWRSFQTPEEVVEYHRETELRRSNINIDIDGLVIKRDRIDLEDMRRARPMYQIAFKFESERRITTVRAVEWSQSGHLYTPVAITDPVPLSGTTVKRASLANLRLIRELGLMIGSRVIITKRGEIIPKIERLVETPPDARPIAVPTLCDACGSTLIDEERRLFCANPQCPKRLYHRIRKWIDTLGIKEFGDVLLTRLFDSGLVRQIADLYSLREGDIAAFERQGEKSAKRALDALFSVREVLLASFVAGFDIEGIGELTMHKVVAAGYSTLKQLRAVDLQQLADIEGLGETMAQRIVEGIGSLGEEMELLLAGGGITIAAGREREPLSGVSFCFTGALRSMSRAEAERLVEGLGGASKGSVTRTLSYLVTNDPDTGSAKQRKAVKWGIEVIDEDRFMEIVDENTLDSTH